MSKTDFMPNYESDTKNLNLMKIGITGATGFLGSSLAKRLDDYGCNLVLVGRNEKIGNKLDDELSNSTFHKIDISKELKSLQNAFSDCDIVVHCAALSSPWGEFKDFFEANIIGTNNVTQSMKRRSRLIHVSTPSIYANNTSRKMIQESVSIDHKFVNHYAHTKYIAEDIVFRNSRINDFSFIGIRPRGIFGEGDTAIMPRILKLAEKGKFPLFNGGEAEVDFTYVGNVVESIICGINAQGSATGNYYNITNGEPRKVKETLNEIFTKLNKQVEFIHIPYSLAYAGAKALEVIGKFTGKEPVVTTYTLSLLAKDQTLDISKARENLNYKPRFTISEGIEHYARWYKDNQL